MHHRPIRLRADLFTPLARTPWAGKTIIPTFKRHLFPERIGEPVGESWEFSCDPTFPSIAENGEKLLDLIRDNPSDMLGPHLGKKRQASCEILVKILNAAEPLSVQVHPRDDDPHLKKDECGKPESWYILDAEPGAGLYLGFSRKMSKDELRKELLNGTQAKNVMHFVPVKKGDYFELEPGVPHAIGPGITLLEPQRILFGLSGKTYRLWDWGRKYDKNGKLDMQVGTARELHLEEGLRLVDPLQQVGEDFVLTTRRVAKTVLNESGIQIRVFPKNPYYQLIIVDADQGSDMQIELDDGYAAFLCLGGGVKFSQTEHERSVFRCGESALLPFAAFPMQISISDHSSLAFVIPAHSNARFHF